ncbi:MAG: GntR family transcriptional regulator [Bacteroidales bacterium]|nr:GntR family transcriptional regulator [Bacteroidales bacterium]
MEFNAHKPIYLQICTQIYEQILSGELKADDRLLSVRDLGVQLGVNPNTIMRSYETMQSSGIIYNKRGIGYFVAENAKELVLNEMKAEFLNTELPQVIKKMKLLGITGDEFLTLLNQTS